MVAQNRQWPAYDDASRIQQIDRISQPDPERDTKLLDCLMGHLVRSIQCLTNNTDGYVSRIFLNETWQDRIHRAVQTLPYGAKESLGRDKRFQTTSPPAITPLTVRVDRGVTKFAGDITTTVMNLSVDQQGSTQSFADLNEEEIVEIPLAGEPFFRQCARAGIILQEDRTLRSL